MKILAHTMLSGGTSFFILSGIFPAFAILLIGYGSLLLCQSLAYSLEKTDDHSLSKS